MRHREKPMKDNRMFIAGLIGFICGLIGSIIAQLITRY